MAKNLFNYKKLANFKPKNLAERYKRQLRSDMNNAVKARLEQLTAPFVTDFEFEIIEKTGDDGAVVFDVGPKDIDVERSRGPEAGSVNMRLLFGVLDKGTYDAVKVILPKDFSNETAPGTLNTTSQTGYEREDIVVFGGLPGQNMEPRGWSDLIAQEYEPQFIARANAFTKTIKDAFRT